MTTCRMHQLDPGYTSEIDTADEPQWYKILEEFDDANIFQTWSYGVVTSGRKQISHLLLKENGKIVAAAQARIAELPFFNVGIAYIRWGPLWRHRLTPERRDIFRQVLRALRNEFVCKRGLVLRLRPALFDTDPPCFAAILAEEGFSEVTKETRSRTIHMELTPSLEQLRDGMRPHWKRELKIAEKKALEVVEGSSDDLFQSVIDIHQEMVSRKRFVEGNDINQFRMMQAKLPEKFKMRIMLSRSDVGICSGLVCSAIGRTAVYLFGATSNTGTKSNGSYLLHWKLIEQLKKNGCAIYDLNGINPIRNPGTYKFKNDLAGKHGKELCFLGHFDSHTSLLSYSCVEIGEKVRTVCRTLKQHAMGVRAAARRGQTPFQRRQQ